MQIGHLLKKNPQILTFLPEKVTRYYQSTTNSEKGISVICTSLQDKNTCDKSQSIRVWEQDIIVEYKTQHWEKAFHLIYTSTKCTNLWEMQQKITLQWYLTPYRISEIYPEASPQCWRLCGGTGTLYHILWSCPQLRLLWSQVERLLSIITGTQQLLTLGMALLSLDITYIIYHSPTEP